MRRTDIETLGRRMRDELYGNILPFWLTHAVDGEYGGFIGQMSNDLTVDKTAHKGLILNARLLWTFAALHRFEPNAAYLDLARRAYDTSGTENAAGPSGVSIVKAGWWTTRRRSMARPFMFMR
jgi:mannose/cellobiose epimerase-like protein (N-acyl-D-glucosamine 2-epimerase family)